MMLEARRPDVRSIGGWFTDEADASWRQEQIDEPDGCRHVGEAACGDHVEASIGVCADGADIGGHDHAALPQPERGDGTAQQIGASRPPLDHHDGQVGSATADHQCRQATAGSEIDHRSPAGWNQCDEPIRMADGIDQRLLADRTPLLDDTQRGDELGVIRHCPV